MKHHFGVFLMRQITGSLLLILAACAPETNKDNSTDTVDTGPQTSTVELANCDTPLPALDWGDSGPIEALDGIDEELAGMDFSALPDPIDVSQLLPLYLGFVAYALEIPPHEIGTTITHQQAEDAGDLGRVVLGSLLLGQDSTLGIDFEFFRRGFYRYYTCSRSFPTTLEGFKEVYSDYDSASGTVVDSIAKCGDRNLILNASAGVYVAESITDGPVRETEILLQGRRNDEQLEFLVYDQNGMLSTRTQFPTINDGPHIVTSAPYACMSCHFNAESSETAWGFDILVSSAGPCQ
jgi:hypothetical protein